MIQRPTILLAAASVFCLASTASGADLTGADIKTMISGKTMYLEVGGGGTSTGASGPGVIYYGADGTALYKTPKGEMWTGTWTIKDNTQCTVWKQAPSNACTRYDKQGDTVTLFNTATGLARGKITKTADGNAEKLAP